MRAAVPPASIGMQTRAVRAESTMPVGITMPAGITMTGTPVARLVVRPLILPVLRLAVRLMVLPAVLTVALSALGRRRGWRWRRLLRRRGLWR
ncbi:hypothetical protein GCM10023074_53380 [Microbispora amethystogenes]|uniref:Uncharacterized protein n=1 Tax=Microbispora amethystogenes TaxID=1427754 RepID=A0ABQ4FHC1_9ACTN|nr:hypothetical protein Mam01_43800 [Microbispora amethystogenes]